MKKNQVVIITILLVTIIYIMVLLNSKKEIDKEQIFLKNQEYTKPTDEELKEKLTDYKYYITQKGGTEKPFENEYWDNNEPGIYVDIITGEPLFSSQDKFDSQTGWPSFTKPLDEESIIESPDYSLGVKRTEITSALGDTHLGHVFQDGPEETGGERYCVNSASLKFIHKDNLVEEGYGQYLYLFE